MRTIDLENLKAHIDEGSMILAGLDDCIVGVNENNQLVYGYCQLLKHYTFAGMTHTEAIDYVEYNICGLLPAGKFSILYELDYMV